VDYPKLRYGVEVLPIEVQNRSMILLRDQLGYSDDSLILSPAAAHLLMGMNGQNSLRDLQAHFMRATGSLIYLEQLEEIQAKLDEHLFLDNERFHQQAAELRRTYAEDPVRRMTHAGKSYPGDPTQLQQELASYFLEEAGGPGIPQPETIRPSLLGMVAPHIDIKAGGVCYAHAYKALCESQAPTTWVVLGTGHQPVENLFAVTRKDFETPLGTIGCDLDLCEALLRRGPRDLQADEYEHRREHTIEFQALFLALCQPRARIVPMLCGFSWEHWETELGYIDDVAALLREITDSAEYPVGLLASVDLAHIGPRYGDSFRPHAGTVREHMDEDAELLVFLERCDPQGFADKLRRERNKRRICGLAPLYLLVKVLEGRACGKVLHHAYATVDQHQSFVTFASMAFYPPDA
jgi:MEMO1 family protein